MRQMSVLLNKLKIHLKDRKEEMQEGGKNLDAS